MKADLEIAQSFDDVARFLEINNVYQSEDGSSTAANPDADDEDDTVGLLFIDSTLRDQPGGGFLSGVVSSITHIFSGSEDPNVSQQRVADIEKEISDETRLMQIDVSNENLKGIQESYDVTTIPYLIIFKRGIVVLKEVPNQETHDKILQVLNVNPAAVHQEENNDVVIEENVPEETTPEPISVPVEESSPTETRPVTLAPEPEETNVEEVTEPAVEEIVEEVPEESVEKPVEEETPVEPEAHVAEDSSAEAAPIDQDIRSWPEEVVSEEPPATVVETTDTPSEEKPGLSEPDKAFSTEIGGADGGTDIPRSFELGPRPGEMPVFEEDNVVTVEPEEVKETVVQQLTLAPGEKPETSETDDNPKPYEIS